MNIVSASDGSVPSKLDQQKGPSQWKLGAAGATLHREAERLDGVREQARQRTGQESDVAEKSVLESVAADQTAGDQTAGERVATEEGATEVEVLRWQASMRNAIRCPRQLCERLGLSEDITREAAASLAGFPVFVPLEFLQRIRPADLADPLLRQVLPVGQETVDVEGDQLDPVGDLAASLQPGLIQKYQGRALMVVTGACAVHCRYCFRRHYPYGDAPKSFAAWQPALDAIAQDESIHEVLLSGGDPLTIVDSRLSELATAIGRISHIRRLRIHTRLPVMIPSRVNTELIAWLVGTRLRPIVVVHVNHAQELDEAVIAAFRRLIDAGICVLNQAVLLRGINDEVEALAELSEQLVDVGVMPYYLHQLDRVAGASHFEVSVDKGMRLVASLRERLPGYAVPKYVREAAGEPCKTPLEKGMR